MFKLTIAVNLCFLIGMPTCEGHSRNAGLNLTAASSYVPYFKNDPTHGPYFPHKGLCAVFRLLRLQKNMDFLKKKTANFEGSAGYEENWSTIFRRICPQKSLYAIDVLPRGHSACSNLLSGLGLSALP
jgi:hypothetical protein